MILYQYWLYQHRGRNSRYVLVSEGIINIQVWDYLYALNQIFSSCDLIFCLRYKPFSNSFQTTDGFTSNYSVICNFKKSIQWHYWEVGVSRARASGVGTHTVSASTGTLTLLGYTPTLLFFLWFVCLSSIAHSPKHFPPKCTLLSYFISN